MRLLRVILVDFPKLGPTIEAWLSSGCAFDKTATRLTVALVLEWMDAPDIQKKDSRGGAANGMRRGVTNVFLRASATSAPPRECFSWFFAA
jgi:hypothetical protein